MSTSRSLSLGLLIERRPVQSRWESWTWRAAAVVPGGDERVPWEILRASGASTVFHAATLPLTLHADETADYLHNLGTAYPVVYAVSQRVVAAPGEPPLRPLRLTASPADARSCAGRAAKIVEPVAMPDAVAAWIRSFVNENCAERSFAKRRPLGCHRNRRPSSRRETVSAAPNYRTPKRND